LHYILFFPNWSNGFDICSIPFLPAFPNHWITFNPASVVVFCKGLIGGEPINVPIVNSLFPQRPRARAISALFIWCGEWQNRSHCLPGLYALTNCGHVKRELITHLESNERFLPEWVARAKSELEVQT
jgi:hypothetical protein